jgi:hypothetical protein
LPGVKCEAAEEPDSTRYTEFAHVVVVDFALRAGDMKMQNRLVLFLWHIS